MRKKIISILSCVLVLCLISGAVWATDTRITTSVKFYLQNSNPISGNSYGKTYIKSVTQNGTGNVQRTYTVTTTASKLSGGPTTSRTQTYTSYSTSDLADHTTAKASVNTDGKVYTTHLVSVNDGYAVIGCSGSKNDDFGGTFTWNGTSAEFNFWG